jgi:hypothetical protein
MGGGGCGCAPAGLAAKATCAATMKAGTTNMRTSFFMWSPKRDWNHLRKKYVLPRRLRKYTIRCISPVVLSPDVEMTAATLLHEIANLALANVMEIDYVAC